MHASPAKENHLCPLHNIAAIHSIYSRQLLFLYYDFTIIVFYTSRFYYYYYYDVPEHYKALLVPHHHHHEQHGHVHATTNLNTFNFTPHRRRCCVKAHNLLYTLTRPPFIAKIHLLVCALETRFTHSSQSSRTVRLSGLVVCIATVSVWPQET